MLALAFKQGAPHSSPVSLLLDQLGWEAWGALLIVVKDVIIKGHQASGDSFPCRGNCLVQGRGWRGMASSH